MVAPRPPQAVVIKLRPERAQAIVRERAANTGNVILGSHALKRMEERGISDIEVYRILQTGHVMELPKQTGRKEWQCKIVKRLKGSREAGVVTIIMTGTLLFVKTVEWED